MNDFGPIKRINDSIDFDSQFPTRPVLNDAKSIALSDDSVIKSQISVTAPTHTDIGVSSSSIFTLADPTVDYYYNDVVGFDSLQGSLVLDCSSSYYAQNQSLSRNVLSNEIGERAYIKPNARDLKQGQTLFAPEPEQITALYYRLVDQLSDRMSVNDLNIITNTHVYPTHNALGNAIIQNLKHNILSLNDYFSPFFDTLYRTCINDNVLLQIRSSYENVYQSPKEISIQASSGATDHLRISSLRQARGFIHGITWLMFTTAMNNIFASIRGIALSNWRSKVISELSPQGITVLEDPDPDLQRTIDDFDRIRVDISEWIENLLISRRAMIATHPRYSNLQSPDGCITFFEAHRWLHVKAGEIYFESKHLITTASMLVFSGYLDQITNTILEDGTLKLFDVTDEWMTSNYLISAIENAKELSKLIDENLDLRTAFEQSVVNLHRHYYPPSSLISIIEKQN